MSKLRIIFMGTPDFAVESLKTLVENNYQVVGVITAPDKPAGRGQQIQQSAVKKYAVANNLKILQPLKLKDPIFLKELKDLNADIQIIVAFRMLPDVVWSMPPLGSVNLHGSLLPQYRGAAPINWAVMNGEKETGVSTFFLQHEIDTGKIIFREKVVIDENETAGEVHDKLMLVGAQLVLKTIKAIETGNYPQIAQEQLIEKGAIIHAAPKIFKDDCKIDWNDTLETIYNRIRGLSPYPTAFTEFISPEGKSFSVKLFKVTKELSDVPHTPYNIITDSKTFVKVVANGGNILIEELQLAGKKRMSIREFLKGFSINDEWKVR